MARGSGVVAEERGPEAARRRVEGPERPRAAPGPRPRARCQPSEPSERPRLNNGSRSSSESKLPEAARTQASAAPKPWGEGGGARGLVREPKDDAGDGVAIGGAGGG